MRSRSAPVHFFVIVILLLCLAGCTQQEKTSPESQPANESARAIEIALGNSTVREYLTEPWTVTGVNLNAGSTFVQDGEYVSLRTPNVMIDMESRTLNVYVDAGNRSVVNIYNSPKRVPMPMPTGSSPRI